MHPNPVLEFEPLRALIARYVRSSIGRAELANVNPSSEGGTGFSLCAVGQVPDLPNGHSH
ncbi:MAG TPA: hypothetical protein VK752_09550 [Bryobacteraceae bacterium]|jgi:hypothetical protein|nr:hypothetical protein [Bryobacteraceae bacterium]